MKHESSQTMSADEMFQVLKQEIETLTKEVEMQTYFKKATEMEIERVCKQITKLSKENQAFTAKKIQLEEKVCDQAFDIMKLDNQVSKLRDQIDAFRQNERQHTRDKKRLMHFMETVKGQEAILIEKMKKLKQ